MKHITRSFFGLCLFGVLVILISLQIDLRQKYIQPSLEALFLHNTEVFVEEYTEKPAKYSCSSNVSRTRVEDILCLVSMAVYVLLVLDNFVFHCVSVGNIWSLSLSFQVTV